MAEALHLAQFLRGGWQGLAFAPFRDGVEMCSLCDGVPALALLRYAPGAGVPRHEHMGMETILVLEGAQCDDRGRYETGALVVNPAGSVHRVWSDIGCVVLIHWAEPVRFLTEDET